MKICRKCSIEKTEADFHVHKNGKNGLNPWCKVCCKAALKSRRDKNPEKFAEGARWITRKSRLKKVYGLTLGDYEKLLLRQGGRCAICGGPPPKNRHLCVDHSHLSGKVRGLLCHNCNRALGFLKDRLEFLENAVTYLRGAF